MFDSGSLSYVPPVPLVTIDCYSPVSTRAVIMASELTYQQIWIFLDLVAIGKW